MSQRLYKLISAMTSHEKGHFVKQASAHVKEKKNTYVDLFKVINDMQEYEESLLLDRLKRNKVKLNVSHAKAYLESALIKSLSEYKKECSTTEKIQSALSRHEVFYEKGMYEDAYKTLIKREELAKVSCSFESYQQILYKQQILLYGISDPNMKGKVQEISSKLKQSILELQDYHECSTIFYTILSEAQLLENVIERDRIAQQQEKAKTILGRKEKCLTVASVSFINRTLRGLYYSIDDFTKALEITIEEIESYARHPEFKDTRFGSYFQEFYHLILCSEAIKNYEALFRYKEEFEAIESRSPHMQAMQVLNGLELLLIELLHWGIEKEEALKKFLHYEKSIEACQSFLSPSGYLTVLFNQAKVNFILGNYERSLHWSDKLLEHSKPHLRQDISAIASMFRLINHFQLDNHVLLPYLIKQTYRQYKKINRLTQFDKWIFKNLRKLNKLLPEEFANKALIDKLKSEYMALESAADKPDTGFDFTLWFDSLNEGKTIFELLESRLADKASS